MDNGVAMRQCMYVCMHMYGIFNILAYLLAVQQRCCIVDKTKFAVFKC